MKLFAAITVIIIAVLLYIIVYKIICWMYDSEKKSDKKYGFLIEDYDHDKLCAIVEETMYFVFFTGWILYLVFTRL